MSGGARPLWGAPALALLVGLSSTTAAMAQGAKPPLKTPRITCGCPTARILTRGAQKLDEGRSVSAWLHDGAELLPFARDALKPQQLNPIETPITVGDFAAPAALVPSTSRLVRAHATGPVAEGTFLGILRPRETAPRDTVAVSAQRGDASVPAATAPEVSALWLAPLEERERPGCGSWLTQRVAFELRPGSALVEAFLVTDVERHASALVDARAVGVFGIGRVEVCDQGLPLQAAPTTLEIRPVSAGFGLGEPWVFRSDGTGQADPVRATTPASADATRAADPFPVPGQDTGGGATQKELALAVMGTVVGAAALIALVMFVVIPIRKRRMVDIRCPSCGSQVPVDALDPKTDGFFCPSCGKAGFWKGKGAAMDATPLGPPP